MKRKRLKREDIRRRVIGLNILALVMILTYMAIIFRAGSGSAPPFIVLSLLLIQLFVGIGAVISFRWLRAAALINIFSALAIAYMFTTSMTMYLPLPAALFLAVIQSTPQMVLGLVQMELSGRMHNTGRSDDDMATDTTRLELRDQEATSHHTRDDIDEVRGTLRQATVPA